jgi:hypothetical protein
METHGPKNTAQHCWSGLLWHCIWALIFWDAFPTVIIPIAVYASAAIYVALKCAGAYLASHT